MFGGLIASGQSVKCPNCGREGITSKNAKSCSCPSCKTKITLEIEERKCTTCIGKYEYKTGGKCRYCKWNTEDYWGRKESKMIEDNYKYVDDKNSDLPF